MIRPFDLRDLPLVAQIEHQGTPLFAELALTRRPRPLQSALAGFFSLNTQGVRSYVLREDGEAEQLSGLIQVRDRGDRKYAVITYVAPDLQANHHTAEIWGHLLDHVSVQSGKLGVQHVIAEAPEDSAAIEVLQRAGYAIFLRQDILRLVRTRLTIPADPIMRPCEARDQWGVQQLYTNTVPRLAQLAEGLPRMYRTGAVRCYVLEDQLEIVAYLQVRRGPDGAWFNVFVHPRAEVRASPDHRVWSESVRIKLECAHLLLCAALSRMAAPPAGSAGLRAIWRGGCAGQAPGQPHWRAGAGQSACAGKPCQGDGAGRAPSALIFARPRRSRLREL